MIVFRWKYALSLVFDKLLSTSAFSISLGNICNWKADDDLTFGKKSWLYRFNFCLVLVMGKSYFGDIKSSYGNALPLALNPMKITILLQKILAYFHWKWRLDVIQCVNKPNVNIEELLLKLTYLSFKKTELSFWTS